MRARLIGIYERLRGNLWFLPAVMGVAAAALAWGLVTLDAAGVGRELLGDFRFMNLSPTGAGEILSTVASGMLTVASLVFSLTFIALTLLSQQLGPRLLLIFMQDRTTQLTLGTFVAGFIYSLLVMGMTGTGANNQFVPQVSTLAAIVIAIAAVGFLVYFLHHIALFVQADHTLAVLAKELDRRISDLVASGCRDRRNDGEDDGAPVGEEREQFDGQGRQICSPRDGYVYLLDFEALLRLACEHDLKVLLDCRPGDFLISGQPMMRIVGLTTDPDQDEDGLGERLCQAVSMGSARRPAEDMEFEIAALVEVALRALSAGINDPYTASAAIDHLSAALCRLAREPIRVGAHSDEQGVPRLWQMPRRFVHFFNSALQPLRGSVRGKSEVTQRLIHRIAAMVRCLRHRDSAEGVASFLRTLRHDIEDGMANPDDRAQLLAEIDHVLDRVSERMTHLSDESAGCR